MFFDSTFLFRDNQLTKFFYDICRKNITKWTQIVMFSPNLVKNTPERASAYYTQEFHREDYYFKGDEPPGIWSKSCEQLGLTGIVNKEDMASLMIGKHPKTGRCLVKKADNKKQKRLGYDCPFSAPKDYSILWAKAKKLDPEVAQLLENLHEKAIESVINNYILKRHNGQMARRIVRENGVKKSIFEPVKSIYYSKFRHRTSREMDPQLHTHVFIYNVGERVNYDREQERYGALEFGDIYRNQSTIGAVYRAELAKLLQENLNISISNGGHSFKIDGISDKVIQHFSRRRKQILAEAKQRGIDLSDRVLNNSLAIATRDKKRLVHDIILLNSWSQTLKEQGFSDRKFSSLFCHKRTPIAHSIDEKYEEIFSKSLNILLEKESTFSGPQVEFEIAKVCQSWFGMEEIQTIFSKFWNDNRVVSLGLDGKNRERFTTLKVLSEEFKILFLAKKLQSKEKHREIFGNVYESIRDAVKAYFQTDISLVESIKNLGYEIISRDLISSKSLREIIESNCEMADVVSFSDKLKIFKCVRNLDFESEKLNSNQIKSLRGIVSSLQSPTELFDYRLSNSKDTESSEFTDKKIARLVKRYEKRMGFSLGESQKSVLEACFSKENLILIEGKAGTGKTTIMELIKEGYGKKGRRVLGLAPSHRAREELESRGIKSRVFQAAITANKKGKEVFRDGDVLICDEMGMVGTKDFLRIMEMTEGKDIKVILVGDCLQITPVSSGSPFRLLLNSDIKKSELSDVIRQKDPVQREAAIKLRDGKTIEGLSMLYGNGNIQIEETLDQVKEVITQAFIKNRLMGKEVKITVSTNDQVNELNHMVREKLVQNKLVARKGKQFTVVDHSGDTNKKYFAKGDSIILRKNDSRLGLYNGTRGVINKITSQSIHFTREFDGSQMVIPANRYKNFDYAYASTVHLMQGATTQVNLYLAGLGQDLGMMYVAASRQSENLIMYAPYQETAKIYFQGYERSLDKPERTNIKHRAVIDSLALSSGSERDKYNALDIRRNVKKGALWRYQGPDLISERALREIQELDSTQSSKNIKRALRRIVITPQGVNDQFQLPKSNFGPWQKRAIYMIEFGELGERAISSLKEMAFNCEKGIDSIHSEFVTEKLIERRDLVGKMIRKQGWNHEFDFKIDPEVKKLGLKLEKATTPDLEKMLKSIFISDKAVQSTKDMPDARLTPWQLKAFRMITFKQYDRKSIEDLKSILKQSPIGARSEYWQNNVHFRKRLEQFNNIDKKKVELKKIIPRGEFKDISPTHNDPIKKTQTQKKTLFEPTLLIDQDVRNLYFKLRDSFGEELKEILKKIYLTDRAVNYITDMPPKELAPWQEKALEMLSQKTISKSSVENLMAIILDTKSAYCSIYSGKNEEYEKRVKNLEKILRREKSIGFDLSD